MRGFDWLIHGTSFAHRVFVFLVCSGLVALSCFFHGELGGARAKGILDHMVEEGAVTGKFWHVQGVDENAVVVTGYQKAFRIRKLEHVSVRPGERLSFVIRRKAGQRDWIPDTLRAHGKADFKVLLSLVAVVWALSSCFRSIGLDVRTRALRLKRERPPCPTD